MTPHAATSGPNGSVRGNGHGKPPGPSKRRPAPDAGPLGLGLFLVSLAVLFLGSLVAYLVVRFRAAEWPPPGLPPLPDSLWASTALIASGSVTIEGALRAVRKGRSIRFRVLLCLTLALGLAFLATQTASWIELAAARTTIRSSLFGYLFYFLTGLHALHVLGGLVPLVVVTVNSFYGRYTFLTHGPVRYCAMYWHFLGGVWATLFLMFFWTV